jgi:hypothetical protein
MLLYKFNTQEEAEQAVQQCNTHYGIPVSPDAVTQTWCSFNEAALNIPSFFYITYDASLEVVLGEPIDQEVIYPERESI